MENSQNTYWDEVAESKTFSHVINDDLFDELVNTTDLILDYGCGYGRISKYLWDKGYTNIQGIDTSIKMIMRGKKAYPDLSLVVNLSKRVPKSDESYNVVILFAVLTCIPCPDNQAALIAEIYRILKPGGILYLSDVLIDPNERNLARYEAGMKKYNSYGAFDHEEGVCFRHHSEEYLDNLLSRFQLLNKKVQFTHSMNGNLSKTIQIFARKAF